MTQAARKIDTQALVVTEFSEFESKMIEFRNQYDNIVYNLEDADQEKKARSDRYTIGKVISALDAKHKDLKAPLKAQVDLIDGERKRIKDELLTVQDKIKSQIETHERKIQEHAEMLQTKVEAIRALVEFGDFGEPTSSQVAARLAEVKAIEVDDSYEHRKADATLAQVETIKTLETAYAHRLKYEQEQAELEQLRKEAADRERADREERIRAEAAAQAKKTAEQAAQAVIEEAKRRQVEAEKAAERAAQAERERIETEQRQAAAEAARLKQAEDAKKAKQEHRAKIHGLAKQSFIDNGIPEKVAEEIVTMIKDGLIKNIQINY